MIGEPERILYDSPAFKARLRVAMTTVAQALGQARRPYVAFSGGKDSLATLALVAAVRDDVPLVWSDDELEYPETVAYLARLQTVAGAQLIITRGFAEHAGWFRPWRDRPYWREPLPGTLRIDRESDEWATGQGYDLVLLGLRMDENVRRRAWLLSQGPIYRSNHGVPLRCCPVWDWSADHVWALIAGWGLGYNAVYDRLDALRVPRRAQRVGPLPLARRQQLAEGWPELLARLEARYGPHWGD